ncbi:MAG: hypothetical protein ACKVS6_04870 [Planctomycetota bacterium]
MIDLFSLIVSTISFAAAPVPVIPVPIIQLGDFDNNGSQDVRITTGSGNQIIDISDDEVSGVRVSVDLNADGDFTDTLEINNQIIGFVDTVSIVTGVGNDVVTVSLGNEGYFGMSRKYIVDLGTGNDSFTFNDDFGTITNSTAALEAYGGTGNDTLAANFDATTNSDVSIRFDGGTGNDNVNITADSTLSTSSLDARAILGAGTNAFKLLVAGQLTGTPSSIICNVDGGKNDDTALFQLTNNINERCFVVLNASLGLGNDTARCELNTGIFDLSNSGNSISAGQLAVDFRGEDGNDTLAVTREFNGVPSGTGCQLDGPLDIHMSGGIGKDTLIVDFGGSNTLITSITTSTRRGLFATLDGGDGDDTFNFQLADAASFTGNYRATLFGGLGNDIFNPITIVTAGAPVYEAGPIDIDGGLGTDTATTSGNGTLRLRHIE